MFLATFGRRPDQNGLTLTEAEATPSSFSKYFLAASTVMPVSFSGERNSAAGDKLETP